MMNRRTFLKTTAIGAISGFGLLSGIDAFARPKKRKSRRKKTKVKAVPIATTETVFDGLMKSAQANNWKHYSIGALIGLIGQKLLGTGYLGGTLDINPALEGCVVNLLELDCVTFFESSLCLARIIKKERFTMDDYVQELTFVRYRHGKIYNYSSRLHYTADWIADNVKKDVVDDITPLLGGEPIKFDLSFMSENSELYPALRRTPKLIGEIESIEDSIRKRSYSYIPTKMVKENSNRIQTGDIICIVTSKEGLDYSHTGLAMVEKGVVRFLHASSKEHKVILDVELADYLPTHPTGLGITVLRPKEV